MREKVITLGDKEFTLRANFAASLRVAKEVGDPLLIAREATFEHLMMERGLDYTPKFSFNLQNIAHTLFIGAQEYDKDVKVADVQAAVFEAGLYQARELAGDYVALLLGPEPTIPQDPDAKSPPEK